MDEIMRKIPSLIFACVKFLPTAFVMNEYMQHLNAKKTGKALRVTKILQARKWYISQTTHDGATMINDYTASPKRY